MDLATTQELAASAAQYPAVLDGYARLGRKLLTDAADSMIQFGRVLTEAKPMVPHGQWENWVGESFGISPEVARNYMKVWRRFGENEKFQNVQFSNLQKMLSLPEGTEEAFSKENDLAEMTAREVEEAVKKVKKEAEKELRRERDARQAAEQRAKAAELRQTEPDRGLIAKLAEKEAALDVAQRNAQRAEQQRATAAAELASVRRDLAETEEMLQDNQAEYNRLQAELLNAQSVIARGDAERKVEQQLTAEAFAAATRAFLGAAAQMPYMGHSFANADLTEIRQWDEHLQALEDFVKKARKAISREGAVFDV